jgi:predicted acylesterase/phospholipase RssA
MHLQLDKIENLVLSGGGLLGISYIGLLRYLEEHQATQQIKTVIGSSAGAIFGILFIIGYSHSEIYNKFKDMKFSEYVPITADSLLNLIRVKGLNSGSNIVQFLKDALLDKTGNQNITFRELYERFGIVFKVGSTNLTTSRFELLDHTNHPDLPVYIAVKASITIPFVLEPVIIGEYLYCDGGLCDNLPIDYVIETIDNTLTPPLESDTHETEKEEKIELHLKTLGIYLTNTQECINPGNYLDASIYQYLQAVLHATFLHPTLEKKAKENEKNYKIIIIEIPCDIMTFLKLHATRADVDNIIEIAYETIAKECRN